jgi:nucleotide-binding universal stress UspA family protein
MLPPSSSGEFSFSENDRSLARMVYRSLLVPLDGSSFAEQALPVAIEIAQAAQASVRLVLVHKTLPRGTKARLASLKAERSYLHHVATRGQEITGTRLSAVTLTGSVVPALRDHIHRAGVDLVVMTTHGRGVLERAWLGSVADALIRAADVPILLVRPAEKAPAVARLEVTRLLVPLDGSPLSEEILPPAAAMARLLGAELSLVQLVTPIDLPGEFPPTVSSYDENLTALIEQQAKEHLDNLADTLRSDGLVVSTSSGVTSSAAAGILDLARDPAIGMIALATHGRGGLRRALLGSVADKVIRGSDRPVLIYRPPVPPRKPRQRK